MKKIFFACLLFILPLLAGAQSTNSNRWVVGGSVGATFSDSRTVVNIAPQVGYRFTNWLTTGGGISYNYYKWKNYDLRANYLGLNVYARVMPIPYVQLFAQPEIYRRWGKSYGVKDEEKTFATFLLGGGVMIPVVQGGITVSVYYDVIQDDYSPYKDELMYAVGYNFYF